MDARIRPAEPSPLGPTLAVEELAADKTLTRDFLDVAALAQRFGLERPCQLAAEKDPGFSRQVLADMLATFDRYAAVDLGLDPAAHEHLARTVAGWRRSLRDAPDGPPPHRPGPRRDL